MLHSNHIKTPQTVERIKWC